MNPAILYHRGFDVLVGLSRLGEELFRINAGLAIYVASLAVLRSRRSGMALLVVAGVWTVHEALEGLYYRRLDLGMAASDMVTVMFWPAVLTTLLWRWTRARERPARPLS